MREIAWLLSLGRAEARYLSAGFVDSLAHLSQDPYSDGGSSEDLDVPVIARWNEVTAARDRVVKAKQDAQILELRLQEHTVRAVAPVVGVSSKTVDRRFKAGLAEIQAELDGRRPLPRATP